MRIRKCTTNLGEPIRKAHFQAGRQQQVALWLELAFPTGGLGRLVAFLSLSTIMRLYGDGLAVAYLQCCLVYYAGAAFLYYVMPIVLPRPSVQKGTRKPGQVRREALLSLGKVIPHAYSICCDRLIIWDLAPETLRNIGVPPSGALAVKALIWTLVERLYASGHTKLYSGPITSIHEVSKRLQQSEVVLSCSVRRMSSAWAAALLLPLFYCWVLHRLST